MEIIKIPTDLKELVVNVHDNKKDEVNLIISKIFEGTEKWEQDVEAIEIKGISDTMGISLAEAARKSVKQARLSAEKVFDAKREEVQRLKSEYDLEDKLWLKAKQIMQLKFKAIEEKAEWKANWVKRFEAEQKELRVQLRISQVGKYSDAGRNEFENMSDESFSCFLSALKLSYEAKQEADLKAEIDRAEKEAAEKMAIEQQRIENDRLKAEAAKREKEMAIDRMNNDKRLAEERAIAKKIEEDALEALQAEQAERAKIEAELKAIKEAEIKVKNEKENAEKIALKDAENLAKAPLKRQLSVWVDSFCLPDTSVESEKKELIKDKFESFKSWAKSQIETI